MMHKDLVEKKRWIDEDHFLQALNFCMLLPGPEAQQLAIYIGWLLHRTWGGIVAGVFFVLPSVFILWGLAWLYTSFGNVPSVGAFFYGLKPAVAAIVAEAVIRIGKKSLRNWVLIMLAAFSFIGIYFLNIPFPAIVLSAGAIGFLGSFIAPSFFFKGKSKEAHHADVVLNDEMLVQDRVNPTWVRSLKVMAVCLTLWFSPLILIGLWRGWNDILVEIGVLFSKATVVTFGGAYAVLAYISQQAVEHYTRLTPGSALSAIAAAIVGVVLNLSVIFTYHVLLPEGKGFDWYALFTSVIAFVGMLRFRWGMIPVIVGSALAGYVWKMFL
jgi:chromate transporter